MEENNGKLNWEENNIYKVQDELKQINTIEPADKGSFKKEIEPWISSLLQSDHVSLLLGSGFTKGIAEAAGSSGTDMDMEEREFAYSERVKDYAERLAEKHNRGVPNIEDQIYAHYLLSKGLEIIEDQDSDKIQEVRSTYDNILENFLHSLQKTESEIKKALNNEDEGNNLPELVLVSFLLVFASRVPSRERLNIFTTNYDRLIEHGCDIAGLRVLDRFVGHNTPTYRSSRMEVDVHYNPPGMRGEPRYLEGVVKLFKLHGSLDWHEHDGEIKRYGIPFGAEPTSKYFPKSPSDSVMIYPNPSKDIETLSYPYSDLFRDFSSQVCQPNSVLFVYGYGFGDSHINKVIKDMLSVPSTHLFIISYDNANGRIERFYKNSKHQAQISLLVGGEFGDIEKLVSNYLPKASIDRYTIRMQRLLEKRGEEQSEVSEDSAETPPQNSEINLEELE